MIKRLSSFSVGQTAKVFGLLYAIMGLFIVPFFLIATILSPRQDSGPGITFALALPVLYGILGFVFTAIGFVLYNWIAGMVGGIEIKLDDKKAGAA